MLRDLCLTFLPSPPRALRATVYPRAVGMCKLLNHIGTVSGQKRKAHLHLISEREQTSRAQRWGESYRCFT